MASFCSHWDFGTFVVLSMGWSFSNIFAGEKNPFTFTYEMNVLFIMIIVIADIRLLLREGTIFVQ